MGIVFQRLKKLLTFIINVWDVIFSFLLLYLFVFLIYNWIDCHNPRHLDTEILSWIFTASFIGSCFELSERTTDVGVKTKICELSNLICGTDGVDVSSPIGQCECLVSAVIVCFYFYIRFLYSFLYFLIPTILFCWLLFSFPFFFFNDY